MMDPCKKRVERHLVRGALEIPQDDMSEGDTTTDSPPSERLIMDTTTTTTTTTTTIPAVTQKTPVTIGYPTLYCHVCRLLEPLSVSYKNKKEREALEDSLASLHVFPTLYYLSGYFQNLTLTASHFPGGSSIPLRYLMWAFTTPCFIFSAGHASGWGQSRINFFVGADIVMIAAGYAATLEVLPHEGRVAAEVVSCVAFAITIFGWVRMELASHARAKKRFDQHFAKDGGGGGGGGKVSAGESRGRGLIRAKVYVSAVEMVSWVGFPLVWYLRKFDKLDVYTEEMLYVWLDILSKGVYALCESGLAKSVNHIFWENAILEEVVGQAVEQTAAALSQRSNSPRISSFGHGSVQGRGDRTPRVSSCRNTPKGEELLREPQHQFLRRVSRVSQASSGGGLLGGASNFPSAENLTRLSGVEGVFDDVNRDFSENVDNWLEGVPQPRPLRRGNSLRGSGGYYAQVVKFPTKDLSKLPSHYDQEGHLEILLVDSDMTEVEQVRDLASSMGAKVTHCIEPEAVPILFASTAASGGLGRVSSVRSTKNGGLSLAAAAGLGIPPRSGSSGSPPEQQRVAGSPRDRRKVRPDVVFLGHDSEWKDDWLGLVTWLETSFKGKLPQILLVTPEFISADNEDEMMTKAMSNGASDFMIRPIHRVSLKTRVQNLLKINEGKRVREERDQMEKLLHRMLPQRVMDQLLSGQGVIADSHPDVTILFADIVSFTALSSKIPTSEIILILNELFSEFDRAVDLADVYKVETIGDCYMCAAGHDGSNHHADRMVDMAQRIIDAVQAFKSPHDIRIRIGIHTGNVFTGVVGTKCPRWCFFGDTVNTASRMESTSFPMCIQISENTRAALVEEGSDVEAVDLPAAREIKGKGTMKTYLIKHGGYREVLRDQSPPRDDSVEVA